MSRQAMLRRSELQSPPEPKLVLRPTGSAGVPGFLVDVYQGPTSLLWRASEVEAREAAKAYLAIAYRWSQEYGQWVRS